MNLLTVKDLAVRLEGRTIIEGVSFQLANHDRLSIIGPNGSGKTVLLKSLLDLLPYSGDVEWAANVRVGYVPQKIDADRHLPLTYHDLFAAKCHAVNVARCELDHLAQSLGLTSEMLATPVGHLSGGQFQRGLLGFALIGKPNVLLLDEPTASIDESGEEHIYELLHRLQDEYQLAVIIVSHDLNFVYSYATRVICLNRQMLCDGPPGELTAELLERLYRAPLSHYDHQHHHHHDANHEI